MSHSDKSMKKCVKRSQEVISYKVCWPINWCSVHTAFLGHSRTWEKEVVWYQGENASCGGMQTWLSTLLHYVLATTDRQHLKLPVPHCTFQSSYLSLTQHASPGGMLIPRNTVTPLSTGPVSPPPAYPCPLHGRMQRKTPHLPSEQPQQPQCATRPVTVLWQSCDGGTPGHHVSTEGFVSTLAQQIKKGLLEEMMLGLILTFGQGKNSGWWGGGGAGYRE